MQDTPLLFMSMRGLLFALCVSALLGLAPSLARGETTAADSYEDGCTGADGAAPCTEYFIATLAQLRRLSERPQDWADEEVVVIFTADIDASETSSWNDGAGFSPIGNFANPFNGDVVGDGYAIFGLTINRPSEDAIGLFGFISGGNYVYDLSLFDVDIRAGTSFPGGFSVGGFSVGGLAGMASSIVGCYVSGRVSGRATVGGLAGQAGDIFESVANVTVSGDDGIGGLAGFIGGYVDASYATGRVSGGIDVGGLVGDNFGTITASYATGRVSGGSAVGGLVGTNFDTITASYATGRVSGGNGVGGLVGQNRFASGSISPGAVTASYATGSVSGENTVGGLVGANSFSEINASYATGPVTGGLAAGGLVGSNDDSTITASYATGPVTGTTFDGEDLLVGGLAASNVRGTITRSYWNTQTSGLITGVVLGNKGGVSGLTSAQMMLQGSFFGWDFSSPCSAYSSWRIGEGASSPILAWQLDADSDGVCDEIDAFPNDPFETVDSDGDGLGNNADQCDDTIASEVGQINAGGCGPSQRDSDGDGVYDTQDAFPNNPNETLDSDGDGYGDNEEVEAGTDPNDANDPPVQAALPTWLLYEAAK